MASHSESTASTSSTAAASQEGALTTDVIVSSLSSLRKRQEAVLSALRHSKEVGAVQAREVEATFSQLPEYTDKLKRVQAAMDSLAARTADMRNRLELQSPPSERDSWP
jgi:molecular chaperone GrpE (heat shock protein)